jgi:hypothetical protein
VDGQGNRQKSLAKVRDIYEQISDWLRERGVSFGDRATLNKRDISVSVRLRRAESGWCPETNGFDIADVFTLAADTPQRKRDFELYVCLISFIRLLSWLGSLIDGAMHSDGEIPHPRRSPSSCPFWELPFLQSAYSPLRTRSKQPPTAHS